MEPETEEKLILEKTGLILGAGITKSELPRRGIGSSVLAVRDSKDREYIVKVGEDVGTDISALEIIARNKVDIPVPKVVGCFDLFGKKAIVMEKVPYSLLEDVPDRNKSSYIIPMLETLDAIHKIKSAHAGAINGEARVQSWKKFLAYRYSGGHPWFDWAAIRQRKGVDSELIAESVARISREISIACLPESGYSLLHTDFNQRNLFVDMENHKLAGVIDWSEAIYGDALYDFSRVHMLIIHFGIEDPALGIYYRKLDLDGEELAREELYLKSQMLDYIAWYSEERSEFNDSRLRLHQDFLRKNL